MLLLDRFERDGVNDGPLLEMNRNLTGTDARREDEDNTQVNRREGLLNGATMYLNGTTEGLEVGVDDSAVGRDYL